VLHDAEYRLAAVRRTQIVRGLAPIAETYDAEHLKALHGWLFQDVYEWAGRVRDVPISKMTDFAPLDRIDGCLQNAAGLIAETRSLSVVVGIAEACQVLRGQVLAFDDSNRLGGVAVLEDVSAEGYRY
jgi:fido (protein-threonine AMPylation protein)